MANTDIEIRFEITNGSANHVTGRFPLNTPLHIEITPDKLYGVPELHKTPALTYHYSGTGNTAFTERFTLSDNDKWILDTSLQYYQAPTQSMYCTVSYEYIRKYAEIKNNLIRCSTDHADGFYPLGEITIKVTADDHAEFQVTPIISYYEYDKTSLPWKKVYKDHDFQIVNEAEYTITVTLEESNEVYTVSAEAVEKTDVTDKYGLICVYKPDKDTLVKLSKVRFSRPERKQETVNGVSMMIFTEDEYIDTISKYAVSLRKMYFKVRTTVTENICLGPYNTEISCPVVGTDVITLDMGTIAITGRHNNIMDYRNTEIVIYLPFAGFVTLETADYMDKTVSLKYEINVINGDALAVISADGNVMRMIGCNASYPVPYRLDDREYVNSELQANTFYLLQEKPFIYVKSFNEAEPDAKMPYNTTKYYAKFADVHGYTQATEIDYTVIHDYITKTEIDEIIRLIESGIFLQ